MDINQSVKEHFPPAKFLPFLKWSFDLTRKFSYTGCPMKNRNPFEILGIAPNITRSLEGKDLFSLIKSSYRALMLIYHPDRGPLGDQTLQAQRNQKVAEINLAFEKLDHDRHPESLEHYRELYGKKRPAGWKKIIRELNREIQGLSAANQTLSQGYLHHILQSIPRKNQGADPPASIFNLENRQLGLQDIAINHNIRSLNWNLGTNYKEIKFDAEGRMFYKLPCRKRFLQVNFIKLLGTVDKKKVDLIPLLDRVVPRDQLRPDKKWKKLFAGNLKYFDILNSISLDEFRTHCLPHLKPELKEGSFLFSLHCTEPECDHINLEGLIVRLL
jgi:curved DNA-binding protein CbpA